MYQNKILGQNQNYHSISDSEPKTSLKYVPSLLLQEHGLYQLAPTDYIQTYPKQHCRRDEIIRNMLRIN